MSKKQSVLEKINNPYYFLTASLAIIVLTFAFFTPKVSSSLFPFKRDMVFNNFLNSTKNENTIDPQKFWEFREFYSPGYFTFSKSGITKSLTKNAAKEIGINYDEKTVNLTFLFFSSQWLNSLDMLTQQTDLNKIINLGKIPQNNIIFMGKNCLIYKSNPNIIKIVFLLSNDNMQKVSGLSDYEDSKMIRGKNWLNVTSLKIK